MKYTPLLIIMLALCACDKTATEANIPTGELSTSDPSAPSDIEPLTDADGKITLDKTHILTDTPKADTKTYNYPIALDSMAVKNYAKAYNITDKQAQHSMVIAMASPEVLSKILDQLRDGKYITHQLTDGADMMLIITTTPDVMADKFDYVFEDEFGQGLVLPVMIQPKA